MQVLLVGEYSRLHNSLKEGLQEFGNDVFLAGMQDSFKKFSTDFNYDAQIAIKPVFKIPNKIFNRIFKKDLSVLERGIRYYLARPMVKNYEVVQLVDDTLIQTFAWVENIILKTVIEQYK